MHYVVSPRIVNVYRVGHVAVIGFVGALVVARRGIARGVAKSHRVFPLTFAAAYIHGISARLVLAYRIARFLFETAYVLHRLQIIVIAPKSFCHFQIAGKFGIELVHEITAAAPVGSVRLLLRHPLVPRRQKHVVYGRLRKRVFPFALVVRAQSHVVRGVCALRFSVVPYPTAPAVFIPRISLEHRVAERARGMLRHRNRKHALVRYRVVYIRREQPVAFRAVFLVPTQFARVKKVFYLFAALVVILRRA